VLELNFITRAVYQNTVLVIPAHVFTSENFTLNVSASAVLALVRLDKDTSPEDLDNSRESPLECSEPVNSIRRISSSALIEYVGCDVFCLCFICAASLYVNRVCNVRL
jgi:hypothetical protein